MIKNFNDKKAEQIFNGIRCAGYSVELQKSALKRLKYLNRAQNMNDLRVPPSNRFEALEGRHGVYSIRINNQWRITFGWNDGATDVKIEDYH